LDDLDPDKEAPCLVGIRREESANRAQFPEHTEESPKHGGRQLWAPLVRHTAKDRDELISKTPFEPLPFRSKECYPCVNANKGELRHLDPATIARVQMLEIEMGVNSKGNDRVLFSPARHGGAIGIVAVVEDAKKNSDDLFQTVACDSGWCGG
jgi:3'-phosphoadenosine 5'-phosphosulfate sulfotransferase (PAPS reductase)/FAD synthetase